MTNTFADGLVVGIILTLATMLNITVARFVIRKYRIVRREVEDEMRREALHDSL